MDSIEKLNTALANRKNKSLVVFSTYQSIEVIAKAQKELAKSNPKYAEFDLIICDEAHRTTGVSLANEDESAFTKVHNNDFIKSKKRPYMTATPRLYNDETKSKAAQAEAILCSMDDVSLYGEEMYRIGFGEAVRTLAAEAGMQPYRFSNFDKKKDLRFQNYKNIFKDYSKYFHQQLFLENNKDALDYLLKRGLNKNVINEFQLGYVPWKNNFYDDLSKKYTEEDIALTGLYYKNDKTGKNVDRFNSRIIFPVNNISGDAIAFGGRIIRESKLAKYINSPETEFYKKGNMIFNLDKAKNSRADTDEVLIVEGYMDVVSLYAAGIKNVISNCIYHSLESAHLWATPAGVGIAIGAAVAPVVATLVCTRTCPDGFSKALAA